MNLLKNNFDFSVSKTYVSPLYPKKADVLNISVLSIIDVSYIRLNYKKNGNWESLNLFEEKKVNTYFSYFTNELTIEEDMLFYFTIMKDNSFYYYSKLGSTVAIVNDIDAFEIKVNLDVPTWGSNSTCYQIFPDRFKNGNQKIGVKTDEYNFDGSFTKEMDFNSKPLDFEHGKCLDFYNGDLKGIEDSLDYLKNLGISCIYLNPIGVSKTTHRYDCCDFFHVDPKLGGDQALISLIDHAHKKEIKVIVDISINHTGIEHPWFIKALNDKNSNEAKYYYIDKNNEIAFWQGVKTLPQLNYNNQELRNIMYRDTNSVIKKFLKEPFNQDGWRFDVADEVGRKDRDQLNDEIWREVRKSIKDENPAAYILAESWIDGASHLKGDQWDGVMNYVGCGRPIRRWMGEEDRFTCEGWGHSPRKVNEYDAEDLSIALKSQLSSIGHQMAQFQFNLIDSHDTPRLHNNKEVFNLNKYIGSIMLMYTLPGMPSIYYGDEIAIEGDMGSVEMSRYPMQWDSEKWNKTFFNLYKTLGNLREEYKDVFYLGSYRILNLDKNVFTLIRYNKDKVIFTILNKSKEKVQINIDIPYLLLSSIDQIYFDVKIENKTVYLNCEENAIFVYNRINS